MAKDEPLLTSPQTQEVATHVDDYSRFVWMLKWAAIAVLIIAFTVLLIIS